MNESVIADSMKTITKLVFLVVDVDHPAYGSQIRQVCDNPITARQACCEGESVVGYDIRIEVPKRRK